MKVVYKYQLNTSGRTELDLPKNAEPIRVDVQNNGLFLWAIVEPQKQATRRVIEVFGTGHQMPDAYRIYINTFFVKEGEYVFHAFETID